MLAMVMFFPKGMIGTLLDWQYSRKVERQSGGEAVDEDDLGLAAGDFATAKGKV